MHRYYDPSTGQFLSVDPLVDETGQAYSYTGNDPVDETDPSGEIKCKGFFGWVPGCGTITDVQNRISGVADPVDNFLNNEAQTLDCNAIGGGNSIFNGILGCDGNSGSSSSCPAAAGALNPGSSEADARSALESNGIEVPSDYYASPSRNGNGWVFRPDGSTNDDNAIRIMEKGADPQYPNGYFRLYDAKGIPIDGDGTPLGNYGVGQEDTHFPLDPDPLP